MNPNKSNIIISLQDKTLNYVNLALNIHGELNISNMIM